MKKFTIITLALAAVASFASCDPESNPQEEPKSTECKLSKFTVFSGEDKIEAFIDQGNKTIEISCLAGERDWLCDASAEVKISAGASISPDPAESRDYTQEVKFTVTAEDGETCTEYTVFLAEAEFDLNVEMLWAKTYGELGGPSGPATENSAMCGLAFSGANIVFDNLQVVDLEGNKVGTLNIEGLPSLAECYAGRLGSMSNTAEGTLVAAVCHGGADESHDGDVMTDFYAWIDGWDQPATLILHQDAQCWYISAAGNILGDFLLNYRGGYCYDGGQLHQVFEFHNGQFGEDNATWYGAYVPHPSTTGVWGQNLSFYCGDRTTNFCCWNSIGANEIEEGACMTTACYVYPGLAGVAGGDILYYDEMDETPLYGNISWAEYDKAPGAYGFGNYSAGHVRAFRFNGQNYAAVSSSSWDTSWLTITRMDNFAEDDIDTEEDESENNYLLRTVAIEGAAGATYTFSGYYYDATEGAGYVAAGALGMAVNLYKISVERL